MRLQGGHGFPLVFFLDPLLGMGIFGTLLLWAVSWPIQIKYELSENIAKSASRSPSPLGLNDFTLQDYAKPTWWFIVIDYYLLVSLKLLICVKVLWSCQSHCIRKIIQNLFIFTKKDKKYLNAMGNLVKLIFQ